MHQRVSEQEIEGNQSLLNILLTASHDMIFRIGEDGIIRDFYSAIEIDPTIHAYDLVGKRLDNIFSPDQSKKIKLFTHRTLQTGRLQVCESSLIINGQLTQIEARYVPCGEDEVITIVCDITGKKRIETALQESEARFRNAFDYAAIGRAIAIPQGRFIRVNNSFCQLIGYTNEELLTKTWLEITHPNDLKTSLEYSQDLLTGKIPSFRHIHRLIHKNEKHVWVDLTVVALRDQDGKPIFVFGDIVDITEQKKSEQVLKYLATHDPLTGLPNRTLFSDRLHHALLLARRSNSNVAVMFIDLDGFKSVNDAFGHEMGDHVLERVARRLNSCVRESDTLARFSGDEFTLVVENITNPEDAAVIAQKIVTKLSVPLQEEGQQITITASIGISIYPDDGEDERRLLKTADEAMYRVKKATKNGFRFYS